MISLQHQFFIALIFLTSYDEIMAMNENKYTVSFALTQNLPNNKIIKKIPKDRKKTLQTFSSNEVFDTIKKNSAHKENTYQCKFCKKIISSSVNCNIKRHLLRHLSTEDKARYCMRWQSNLILNEKGKEILNNTEIVTISEKNDKEDVSSNHKQSVEMDESFLLENLNPNLNNKIAANKEEAMSFIQIHESLSRLPKSPKPKEIVFKEDLKKNRQRRPYRKNRMPLNMVFLTIKNSITSLDRTKNEQTCELCNASIKTSQKNFNNITAHLLRHLSKEDQMKYCNSPKNSNMTLNEKGKEMLKTFDNPEFIDSSIENKEKTSSDQEESEEEVLFKIEDL